MLYELIAIKNGEVFQKRTFAELPQPLSTKLLVGFFLRLSTAYPLGAPRCVTFGKLYLTAETGASQTLLLVSESVEYGLAAGLMEVFSKEDGFCASLSDAVAAVANEAFRSITESRDTKIHLLRAKTDKMPTGAVKLNGQEPLSEVIERFLGYMTVMQVEHVSLCVGTDFLQLLQNDAVSVAYAEPFEPQRVGGPSSVVRGCRMLQACAALEKQIVAE